MYNKLCIIGHIVKDIQISTLSSGSVIGKSSIASTHTYKTQTGEKKEETCFLEFCLFGQRVSKLEQYLKKGTKVLLEGRLVHETWTSSDATKRSKHSLNVDDIKFI